MGEQYSRIGLMTDKYRSDGVGVFEKLEKLENQTAPLPQRRQCIPAGCNASVVHRD